MSKQVSFIHQQLDQLVIQVYGFDSSDDILEKITAIEFRTSRRTTR